MGINYDEFIRRLKEERVKHQISYRGMGEKVQISHSQYYKGENGYSRLSNSELQNICSTKINIFYSFTGKAVLCTNTYEEIFENADCDALISCLRMINILANQKRKTGRNKSEWEKIFSETEYLSYVYTGSAREKNVFKATRDYYNILQNQMATELGMDVKTLRNLENDKTQPDSEIIFKMYLKYGISPSVFLKNKRCFQDELTYLLNSQSGEVGDTLLHFVKTIMLLVR